MKCKCYPKTMFASDLADFRLSDKSSIVEAMSY